MYIYEIIITAARNVRLNESLLLVNSFNYVLDIMERAEQTYCIRQGETPTPAITKAFRR